MSSRTASVGRGRIRLTGRAALLAVMVLLLAMATVVPLRQYFEQRSQIAELEETVATLEDQRAGLSAQLRRLRDPEYLEQLARQCLGMVKPGEIRFVTVPEGGGAPKPPRC
jgi:cell division protein FtsB